MASIAKQAAFLKSLLPQAMAADRLAARREIRRLTLSGKKSLSDQQVTQRLRGLEKRLQASILRKCARKDNLPNIKYNNDLPITAKKDEIIQTIAEQPVVIVSGETGSGKTTQMPKFCLAAGRGIDGLIGHTQPRRIAVTTVADRIAEEFGQKIGRAVGYKIRFQARTPKDAYIKLMTDGILLAETQSDRYLSAYDTIIVDEAHERSLNIDFILGILQTLLTQREDLKIIITSATIDTQKFSKAFNHAPVIEVSGRMYPVEVRYQPPEEAQAENNDFTHVELAVQALKKLQKENRRGDILVFMPTEQDIRDTCELIEADKTEGVRVLPLFARLTAAEQSRVFKRVPARKIIVATNVAETSITIPGITYVIDSGLARISRYSPRSRTTSLPVLPISRSSADQRKGRCGRVENGVCIRLYSKADYESRPIFTAPEIMRANLAEVILRMIALKLGDISDFPFIDRPDLKNIRDGFNLLIELGAIKQGPREAFDFQPSPSATRRRRHRIQLTEKGRWMAKIPIDPRLSRMLIQANEEGCMHEIAVIASALSIQDPRERPAEKTKEADRRHAIFNDPNSDFVSLLNIWNRYHHSWQTVKTNNQMKRFCHDHYLSFRRIREWRDIYHQIVNILQEDGKWHAQGEGWNSDFAMGNSERGSQTTPNSEFRIPKSKLDGIHKSILCGFLSNIGVKKEKNIYRAAKGKEVMIFPGSGLFNNAAGWIVAAEMVETKRVFARTVANIDSGWLEDLAKDLCRRTYRNPRWQKNRGEVVATEQVSLFGLPIVSERTVSYGRINPEEATAVFIRSALIEGAVENPFAFMRHNQRLIDDIKDLENRLRRRDILISAEQIYAFYKKRLGRIYDLRTLSGYLKAKGNDSSLRMKKEDLLLYDPEDAELALYPQRLDIGNLSFDCSYRFAPGAHDDGVTIQVPFASAQRVPAEAMDWLVPGLYKEKLEALIKGLPKVYRKKLLPLNDTVDIVLEEMPKSQRSLIAVLGEFIRRRLGVDIPACAWQHQALPDHLKMRVSIRAPDGRELDAGRDAAILQSHTEKTAALSGFELARRSWERTGITRWDFGDLPDFISNSGTENAVWLAYPTLEKAKKDDKSVNLRLFQRREEAITVHRQGVAVLYRIHFAKDLKFLKKRVTLPADVSRAADYFGGARRLEKRMHDRIIQNLFAKNIRSENDFHTHAEAVGPTILPRGQEFIDKTSMVLRAYDDTRTTIYELQRANLENSGAAKFFQSLLDELVQLVPESFIDLYDLQRLAQLGRYIQALRIRAQRAFIDFEKDQAKFKEVHPFSDSLTKLIRKLSPTASEDKRRMIEDFFWMVEEFKVSVFAQELKTAFPVSKKRLEKQLKQIERMI